MQFLNKIQGGYDQLWKYIIRPTRTPYPEAALGPQTFCLENIKIKRNSFQLINDRGHVFFGSHFVPLESDSYPCVIYLHGNSSNQTEGMEYLSELIKHNISLCTFDFSGCGNSEGEYVTLGYYQWKDLEEVVMHIKAKEKVTKIGIWGRSMGAVTALRFAAKHPQIAVGIYDSPFKSLKSLVGDLCKKNSKIPMFILSGALKIIASTIKEKANFDLYDLDPLKNEAPEIKVPGFFIVSEDDQLIPFEHTKLLYEAYKSKKKQIRIVKGEHNGTRPDQCIKDVIKYLRKYLLKLDKADSKQKSPSGMKIEDVDFFNDDFPEDLSKNSSQTDAKNELNEIDFFNEVSKKELDNDFQKFANQQSAYPGNNANLLSSLNQMFAGVFSTKVKKQKQVNDGYEQLRSRVTNIVTDIRNLSEQNRRIQTIMQNQLKKPDQSFEKLLEAQLSQYCW